MMLRRITFVNARIENAATHQGLTLSNTDPRDVIRELRQARGFRSVRALAIAAGIQQPTLARYLNGKSADMEMPQWRALAAALGVCVSELLGELPLLSDASTRAVLDPMKALSPRQRSAIAAAAAALASSAAGDH